MLNIEIKDVITGKSGSQYKIVEKLHDGGQGKLWIVDRSPSDGKKYVLKIIYEKNPEKHLGKCINIICLYILSEEIKALRGKNENAKSFRYMLPMDIYQVNEGGLSIFGYLMELCNGVSLSEMFRSGEMTNLSLREKYQLMLNICYGLEFIASSGRCYQDISHSNLFYNKASEEVVFIDCDNISPHSEVNGGKRAYAKGTGWFIAPEVAFLKENAAKYADRYAMAVLFYMILTGSLTSPYHGKLLYQQNPPFPSDMGEAADEDWREELGMDWLVFIFDPNNTVNSIEDIFRDGKSQSEINLRKEFDVCIENWNNIPPELQKLFVQAFQNPLEQTSWSKRPTPGSWKRVLSRLLLETHPHSTIPNSHNVRNETKSSKAQQLTLTISSSTKEIPLSELIPTDNSGKILGTIRKDGKGDVFFRNISGYTLTYTIGNTMDSLSHNDRIFLNDRITLALSTRPENTLTLNLK